jgi:hypothetical protein
MLLPTIVVGLYYLFNREINSKALLKYIAVTIVSFLILTAWVHVAMIDRAAEGAVSALFILGILPFLGDSMSNISAFGTFYHSVILLAGVNIFVFGAAMFMLFDTKRRKNFAIVLLAIMFAYGTYFGQSTTMMRSSNASYNNFFSGWAEPRRILEDFRELHDEFPYLYIVSNRLATTTASHSIIQSRGQLIFMNFTVTQTIRMDNWPWWDKSENAMIVSDRDWSREEIGEDTMQIHSSQGMNIWIMGDEIIEFYRNWRREGANLS